MTADNFASYFVTKITRIRASTSTASSPNIERCIVSEPLFDLSPVTANEMKKFLTKSPAKLCQMNPMPTWLVKRASNVLDPIIFTKCRLANGTFGYLVTIAAVIFNCAKLFTHTVISRAFGRSAADYVLRSVCTHVRISVCLSVCVIISCKQNISKSYKRIFIKFSGEMQRGPKTICEVLTAVRIRVRVRSS